MDFESPIEKRSEEFNSIKNELLNLKTTFESRGEDSSFFVQSMLIMIAIDNLESSDEKNILGGIYDSKAIEYEKNVIISHIERFKEYAPTINSKRSIPELWQRLASLILRDINSLDFFDEENRSDLVRFAEEQFKNSPQQ